MARIRTTGSPYQGISGRVGNLVFRNTPNGVVVANRPRKTKSVSTNQKAVRNRFSDAAFYAREQMKDIAIKELYESGVNSKMNSPYLVAVSDYLTAPKIGSIFTKSYQGQAGETVGIHAKDDFWVVAVMVQIHDSAGKLIESGEASQMMDSSCFWDYVTTQKIAATKGCTITAIAQDFAGNKGSKTITL
ncbi:hypothetical protein WBG78_27310 [Chryseolinea sp. T2]|uniref:hypothetical protein n=1 Tax=Chryseolinea sp. T2 TaxID=3129255 RepID=UPI0030776A1F